MHAYPDKDIYGPCIRLSEAKAFLNNSELEVIEMPEVSGVKFICDAEAEDDLKKLMNSVKSFN